jgi:PadR family transcriptional regulator PadR
MNSQLKRGMLDLFVFVILNNQNCYGYKLVEIISKNIEISEGTIYPLLKRLKDEQYVDTYLTESNEGPPRKFYTLTQKGRNEMEVQYRDWMSFKKGVANIMREGGINE